MAIISGSAAAVSIGAGIINGNDHFYSNFLMPAVHRFADGEQAHRGAIFAAKNGFFFPGRKDKKRPLEPRVRMIDGFKTSSCDSVTGTVILFMGSQSTCYVQQN